MFYVDRFQPTNISWFVCKQFLKKYKDRFKHTDIKYSGTLQSVIINIFLKKNMMTGLNIPA